MAEPGTTVAPSQTHVVATGCFDLLHLGHIHFLKEAAKLGDCLTVIVAHDSTMRRLKREPIVPAEVRVKMVEQLKPVDRAVMGNPGHMLDIIDELKPDIIALGHDQDYFEPAKLQAELKARGHDLKVVRLPELKHGLAGSRRMIKRIVELHSE